MKKRFIKTALLLLLLALITTFSVIVFIRPKIEVNDIIITRADHFYSGEKETSEQVVIRIIQAVWELAYEERDNSCQIICDTDVLPSQNMSDYSIVQINMTVTGRSCWDGAIPYFLIDSCKDPNNILLMTMPQPFASDFNRFYCKNSCRFMLYIYSKEKSEEEIVAALKSIRIQVPYTNRVHSSGSAYAACEDVEITFK